MADRIGVINKGELILVEDKAALMQQARQEAADAASAERHRRASRRRSPPTISTLSADGRELIYTFDTKGERTGITSLLGDLGERRHRLQGSGHHAELARGHLRQPGEERPMNFHGGPRDLQFEMARTWRTLLQSIVSPVISTSLYFVVFGSAIGSRITADRRRQLRRLHRAGADHAVAADAEHLQRLVRHLLPEVHRHDLRAAVGAGLLFRDRARLCRRGRDQVDHARPDHPRHRRPVRAAAHRPSRSGC